MDLYQLPLINAAREELVLTTQQIKQPEDWSSDGQFVVYRTTSPGRVNDLWAVSMQGDHKTFAIVDTAADEKAAQFAPDAHWVAFESNETGSYEKPANRCRCLRRGSVAHCKAIRDSSTQPRPTDNVSSWTPSPKMPVPR